MHRQVFGILYSKRGSNPTQTGKIAMNQARRTALKMMSVGAITAFTSGLSFAAQTPRTRRTLTGIPLDDPDLSTYRDFVQIMQSKDQSKPVSWLGFANQHGTLSGGYNFCPHGDWYLLPWHRAYVLMYELAAQELTGNKNFAMPYWNWTEIRTMPEAFANPTYNGKPNPLYVRNRNDFTLPDSIVGQVQVIDKINAETVYEAFGTTRNPDQNNLDPSWVPRGGGHQGLLERTPHNIVHNTIGAFMPTPASPRDPIFFMHHCNIDRIWANWNALGRKNSKDPLWLNMPFKNNFIHTDGTLYTAIVKDLQDITALGYTYDFLPQPDHKSTDPTVEEQLLAVLHSKVGAAVKGVNRFGGANTLAATALTPLSKKFSLSNENIKTMATPKPIKVYLLVRDIAIGTGVTSVRVFVNRPNVTTDVPDTDPHYVTTFSFLDHMVGSGEAGNHKTSKAPHKQLPSALVNLTETLQRLYGFRRLKAGEISVELIPVPARGVILENVGKVVPASIEIVVL
jgi:tyrosinase